jgi:outer membrane protein
MKKWAQCCGIVSVVGLVLSAPASAESLTNALISAYNHSHLLDQQRALLRATDEGVAQAVAATRPTISSSVSGSSAYSASSGFTNLTSGTAALSATLSLYDGGSGKFAIQAAKENVLAARQVLINQEQTILLSGVTAFMDMRRNAEFLSLEENNIRVLGQEVRAANDRFDVGEITRTDVSLTEARLAAARGQLALRQGNLDIAREAYHIAVGHYPGTLDLPPLLLKLPLSLDEARSIAVRHHPLISQAQHAVKAAEWNVKRAHAALGPSVSFSASVSDSSTSSQLSRSISIEGTQVIYAGGNLLSLKRAANQSAEQTRAGLQQTVHSVRQNVANSWAQITIARASIVANQKQIRASRAAYRGVREEASFGARTTLDILNAEQTLLSAQSSLVASRRDEYVAAYNLLASMGLLTASHLGLGVKAYDPKEYYNNVKNAPASAKFKALDRIFKRAGKS